MFCFIWAHLGLLMNFVGTLMMAFSFGKSTVGTEEVTDNGKVYSTASFKHPLLFKWGVILLSMGFLISLIADR